MYADRKCVNNTVDVLGQIYLISSLSMLLSVVTEKVKMTDTAHVLSLVDSTAPDWVQNPYHGGLSPPSVSDTSWNLKAIYAEHSLRPQKALGVAKQRALQTEGFPFASCAHLPLSLWMGIINLSVFLQMKCGWVTAHFLTLRPWSQFLPKSPLLFHGSRPGGPGFYNPLQTFTACWSLLPTK